MGIYRHFPYSNFHEMNLDEFIKILKEMQEEWDATKTEWASYKEFIDNYFDNLNLDAETLKALRRLIAEGVLNPIFGDVISAWLASHITPTTPAIDASLTVSGAGADAKVVGEYFDNDRKNIANNHAIASMVAPTLFTERDFEQGALFPDGTPNPDIAGQTTRVRLANFIKVKPNTTYIFYMYENCPFMYSASFYEQNLITSTRISATDWNSSTDNDSYFFTTPENCQYVKMTLRRTQGDVSILVDDVYNFKMGLYEYNTDKILWSHGTMVANYSGIVRANAGISTPRLNKGVALIPPFAHATVKLYSNTEYLGKIRFDGDLDKVAGNWKFFYNIVDIESILNEYDAKWLMITIVVDNNSYPITTTNYKWWAEQYVSIVKNRNDVLWYLNNYNYVIEANMQKTPIAVEKLPYRISGYQAFCTYNNKYYSTNGKTIFVQNEDFDEITTASLSVGHGNTMQMGNANMCYISGWDDNKVYQVNLDTLTIANTFNLPINGYSNCIVDEINSIGYIIWRESIPETVEPWWFTKYNMLTNEIYFSKRINSFAGIQDADFVNGKIIVAYGLSNTPNGIFVFNTNGDMIADYHLTSMNNIEYEGVDFNKTTHDLTFTDVNRNMYRITTK